MISTRKTLAWSFPLIWLGMTLCVPAAAHAATKKIVGYYYGKGRPGYELSQVPVKELTHLIYSMAKPTSTGACELAHPSVDVPNMQALKALKARNPQLLVLLSVGGWSGSTYFSDLATTLPARKKFAASCVQLVARYGLDGLDIDWEYPVTGGEANRPQAKNRQGKVRPALRAVAAQFGCVRARSTSASHRRHHRLPKSLE